MRRFIGEFIRRGLTACGFGPMVLAVVYGVLQAGGVISTLRVNEVVLGILTAALLAFVAGGINAIYGIERLPLVPAILIHAVVLYMDYVVIYLVNNWMEAKVTPLLVFTGCFLLGFGLIWMTVYWLTKKSADRLNKKLAEHRSE